MAEQALRDRLRSWYATLSDQQDWRIEQHVIRTADVGSSRKYGGILESEGRIELYMDDNIRENPEGWSSTQTYHAVVPPSMWK